jgi:hypothetical protein
VWRRQVGFVRGTRWPAGSSAATSWQEWQDEVMDGFLVEPPNKVKPGLRGSRVMSGDWQRLHRVRGASGGSPKNHWAPWLIHKARIEDGGAVASDRSDRWVSV